jgi:hypothetical protein
MQKEYDSIVKLQIFHKQYIDLMLKPLAEGRNLEYSTDATRQIDSLNYLDQKLEKRKKELAGNLFK